MIVYFLKSESMLVAVMSDGLDIRANPNHHGTYIATSQIFQINAKGVTRSEAIEKVERKIFAQIYEAIPAFLRARRFKHI